MAVIVISVFGLFRYRDMQTLMINSRTEAAVMLLTFTLALLVGVQQGLLVGVILSIAKAIYNTARPHMTELGSIMNGKLYRNVSRFEDVRIRDAVDFIDHGVADCQGVGVQTNCPG